MEIELAAVRKNQKERKTGDDLPKTNTRSEVYLEDVIQKKKGSYLISPEDAAA